jgi:protein SCO1/2
MSTANDVSTDSAPRSPDRREKLLTALLWSVLGLAMAGVIATGLYAKLFRNRGGAGGGGDAVRNMVIDQTWEPFPAPTFSLIDQEGKPFGSEQLRGKPYVAAFIFTHCATSCPMMTQKMAKLQKAVPDKNVGFVSFTVDPERDTPEVLRQYAKNANADAARWHFLTGSPEQLAAVAAGMKSAAVKATDGSDQFIHSDRFMLIDGDGQVRGTYRNSEPEAMDQLAKDAAKLAKGGAL